MVTRKKCLNWTIEWIGDDGAKTLSHSLEDLSIEDAWKRHEDDLKPQSKKRKVEIESDINGDSVAPDEGDSGKLPPQPASITEIDTVESVPVTQHDTTPQPSSNSTQIPNLRPASLTQVSRHFYLLKPNTIGHARVLVPLAPTSSVADFLHNRVVLEFPTIYVLSYAPADLPEDFIQETEYKAQLEDGTEGELGVIDRFVEDLENGELSGGLSGIGGSREVNERGIDEALEDRSKIVNVLMRDLEEGV
jgi:hypothetical protein